MRTVLGLTLLAAAVIAGAWWVAGLPGTVSATIAGTTFQTTSPVALVLLAALFLILYAAVRLLAGLFTLPRRAKRANRSRRRAKGDQAVTRALTALAASDSGAARREAERCRSLLGDTPLTLLLTAQANKQAGRDTEADAVFRLLADRSDAAFLGLRGLLRQAMTRQDWTAAAELAQRADAAYPGAAWLKEERRHLALRTGQWRDALRLSGPDTRAAMAVAAADAEADPSDALRLAKEAWTADPSLPPAAVAYATRLRASGQDRKAQDVLRKSWKHQPHPDMAAAFLAPIKDKLTRYKAAQALAKANPDHPDSHLLQATMALEAGLAGEARRHAEAARSAGLKQRRLWMLVAEIAELDGRSDEAQEALRQAATADPDPVWRCGHCGTVHKRWVPVCDACGTAGKVAWVLPEPTAQPVRRLPQTAPVPAIEGITS